MANEKPFHELISQINANYQNLLGYTVEKTALKELDKKDWEPFCNNSYLNKSSSGFYLPRNQVAVIPSNNKLSLFHEYFGHGLFCEQSLVGKELVNLEKRLLKEEKQEFKGKKFNSEDLQKFRKKNKTFQNLEKSNKKNLILHESFALWTEYFLSREFNFMNLFEQGYTLIPEQIKGHLDGIISFDNKNGDLATFYNFGLARRTTTERVEKLLKGIYGEEINKAKLAVLYGSKKAFSDIDVLLISDNLQEIISPWLDVRVEKEKDFEEEITMFDISITDPILTGEFLIGEIEYLNEKRKQLLQQPITKEAINYNLLKSEEQKKIAFLYGACLNERAHGLSYSKSYLLNALTLQENKRLLTKEKLFSSQGENINMNEGLKII